MRSAAVYSLSEESHPIADDRHKLALEGVNSALRGRSDVEQVVSSHSSAGTEIFDKCRGRLIVKVAVSDAPMVVERTAHLGGNILLHSLAVHRRRSALLEGHRVDLGVAHLSSCLESRVIYDDSIGLILTDGRVKRILLPISILLAPISVKPKTADLAVILAKQLNALAQILKIAVKIVIEVGVVPIERGMVEERNYTVLIAGIDELADEIASRR